MIINRKVSSVPGFSMDCRERKKNKRKQLGLEHKILSKNTSIPSWSLSDEEYRELEKEAHGFGYRPIMMEINPEVIDIETPHWFQSTLKHLNLENNPIEFIFKKKEMVEYRDRIETILRVDKKEPRKRKNNQKTKLIFIVNSLLEKYISDMRLVYNIVEKDIIQIGMQVILTADAPEYMNVYFCISIEKNNLAMRFYKNSKEIHSLLEAKRDLFHGDKVIMHYSTSDELRTDL